MPIWIIRDIQSQPGVEMKGMRDGQARAPAGGAYLPPQPSADPPVADFIGEIVSQGPATVQPGSAAAVAAEPEGPGEAAPMMEMAIMPMIMPVLPGLIGYAPLRVKFTDLSSGPPTSWEWDFKNDGTCGSNATNPVFVYEDPGLYSVSLAVANDLGSDSMVRFSYIEVLAPAAAGEYRFFFAETAQPGGAMTGPAAARRVEFMSALDTFGMEGFEGFATDTVPPLTLFGGMAELTEANTALGCWVSSSLGSGRFNTTPGGSRWWQTSQSFSVNFIDPVKAFGVSITDMGDFEGSLTARVYGPEGLVRSIPLSQTETTEDGGLMFFGFTDTTGQLYTRIDFEIAQADGREDFVGFDDIIIGVPK